MSRPIIEVHNLSKRYHLGAIGATSLREEFRRYWDRLRGVPHPDRSDFWALRDVSFQVQPGEVVGVIGRNGAGKSTLLKILSRITEPTNGKVTMRGRVASLLEVGTGFHPELTGRENIFLNGAILGMSRAEVRRKFDEIVAFAEVDQFIDTPVKRYSSGMYVRLAFAVAAHLEPEILIIDEVLAVGDTAFQSKCLGKMQSVAANGGRTVLFVSHNLAAISHLCRRCILLDRGTLVFAGETMAAIENYTSPSVTRSPRDGVVAVGTDANLWLADVRFIDERGHSMSHALSGQRLTFQLKLETLSTAKNVVVSIGIDDSTGARVGLLANILSGREITLTPSVTLVNCEVPMLPLTAGRYTLSIKVSDATGVRLWAPNIWPLLVESGDFFKSGKIIEASWMGTTLIPHVWASETEHL